MTRRILAVASGVVVTAVSVIATAAGQRATPPDVVPVEREPQHHPVYDNAFVTVLDVRLPPGYVSQFHTHALDNVSVRITTDMIRLDRLDADGSPQLTPVGAIGWNSASPPYTHRVVNVGSSTIRILDVEIHDRLPSQSSSATDAMEGHVVVLDNPRVRATRITLEAGATLPAHTHPRGWLEIAVAGAEPGHFAWHAAGSTVPRMEATARLEIVELEPK